MYDQSDLTVIATSGWYTDKQSRVKKSHYLEKGPYVVIPSTEMENEEGKFLLRIFTEKSLKKKFENNFYSNQ
jgi:hypothetical protein